MKKVKRPNEFYIFTNRQRWFRLMPDHKVRQTVMLGYEEMDWFSHKGIYLSWDNKIRTTNKWKVTEGQTGLAIGYGKTRIAAEANAYMNIQINGIRKINKRIREYMVENGISPRYISPKIEVENIFVEEVVGDGSGNDDDTETE